MRNIKQTTDAAFDCVFELANDYVHDFLQGGYPHEEDEDFERELYQELVGLVVKELIIKLYERIKLKN